MAFNTKTFITRTASAAVFVFVLLSCVWYNDFSFAIFFTVVGFIGLYEFYKLSEKLQAKPNKIIGYLMHAFAMLAIFFLTHEFYSDNFNDFYREVFIKLFFVLFTLCSSFLFVFELFRKNSSLSNIAYTIVALLYVTVPCSMLILLIHHKEWVSYYPDKVLGMIFFIWINDTGAYLVGSFLGKHKLYEKISPNKTWEGTIGGVILCIALSFVMVKLFPQLALQHWIVISIIVAVFGTLGDLVESMLKRLAGVKDTGNIMPGHGGVLDRFDSLLFSTPFVFCYLAAVGLL